MLLIASNGNVWAETSTLTLSSTNKFATESGSEKTTSDSKVTWIVMTSSGAINGSWSAKKSGNTNGYSGEQFGKSDVPWTGTFSATIGSNIISSVAITANTGGSATLGVTVGGVEYAPKTQSVTKKLGQDPLTYTFTGSSQGQIVITVSETSKAFYLGAISVTYTIPQPGISVESEGG